MSTIELGDLVVLTAGSMRMAVEKIDGDQVSTIWCHEGNIGRDTFHARLLKKWEVREDDRGGRPRGGDRNDRGDRGGRDDKPRGKPGWDGKPREKKYFRKD